MMYRLHSNNYHITIIVSLSLRGEVGVAHGEGYMHEEGYMGEG